MSALLTLQATAEEPDPTKITEEDKKVFKGLVDTVARQKLKAVQMRAMNNATLIGIALFTFDSDYGTFPNGETAAQLKKDLESKLEIKSETANDCFFQLIAAKHLDSDAMFSFNEPKAPARPQKDKPLQKIEKCSFAYLSGLDAAGNAGRPLVVTPLVKGKTTFDPTVFGGKAVILKVDNSVVSLPIEPDGRVLIEGKDMFDAEHPIWGGKPPVVKWPE